MFIKMLILVALCVSAALAAALPTASEAEHLEPTEHDAHETLETANTFGFGFYKGFYGGGPFGFAPHVGFGYPYGGPGYGGPGFGGPGYGYGYGGYGGYPFYG